jgi:phosphatidylserine/phosphatidylglycerophosphate/cardiolipin synthase-like enzyme
VKGLVARAAGRRERPPARQASLRLIAGRDHYEELISRELPGAQVAVWIATANLKELRVQAPVGTRARARGRYVSILEVLESLVDRGVELRILHGRVPSRAFEAELSRRNRLARALELRQCPRVHMKTVTVDGRVLYLGSANFTGAGLGARSDGRRNFEIGILTDDDYLLDAVQAQFDAIWSGGECGACRLRHLCPAPIDQL